MASRTTVPFSPTGTESASPSTSTSDPGSQPSSSNTSTLYLVTFLATILVLVLLSVSLVVRSYILRRRYRARFEQALADGLFVDFERTAFTGPGLFTPITFAGPLRRSTRRLGAKPVLWETFIHPSPKEAEYSNPHFWSSITPIAARLTSPLPPSESSSRSPDSSSSPQRRPSFFSYLHLPRSISPFSRSPGSPTSPQPQSPVQSPVAHSQTNLADARSPTQDSAASPSVCSATDNDTGSVSVCVLISMPDAHAPCSSCVSDNDKGKGVDTSDSQSHQQGGDASPVAGSSSHIRPSDTRPDTGPDEGKHFPLVEFGIIEMKATGLGDLFRERGVDRHR